MKGVKTTLSEAQQKWFIKHFKHTKNEDVAAKLGVSQRTAIRLARQLGLQKTRQFMTKCQRATADAAKASHLRNKTYPKKGSKIPRSEEFWFKVGESSLQRLGARREAEGAAKALKIKGDAEAEYNRKISASLSPLIINQEMIDKWDGKLPVYGTAPTLFRDMGK